MNKGAALHSPVGFQLAFMMVKRWKLNRSHLQQFYLVMIVSCQNSHDVVTVLVHALNAVVKTDDTQSLKQACYFSLLLDKPKDAGYA